MKKLTIALLVHLFLSVAALAADDFDFSKIAGRYEGTLEYADYKTDKRVMLKTWLEIKIDGDNDTAIFSYSYDDFGKTVAEQSRHRIDRRAKKYFVDTDEFAIKELSLAKSAGKIVLLGKQIDNETLEPIRKTFVFDQDSLTFLKETRQPFQFRNQYKLKRTGENEKSASKSAIEKVAKSSRNRAQNCCPEYALTNARQPACCKRCWSLIKLKSDDNRSANRIWINIWD